METHTQESIAGKETVTRHALQKELMLLYYKKTKGTIPDLSGFEGKNAVGMLWTDASHGSSMSEKFAIYLNSHNLPTSLNKATLAKVLKEVKKEKPEN